MIDGQFSEWCTLNVTRDFGLVKLGGVSFAVIDGLYSNEPRCLRPLDRPTNLRRTNNSFSFFHKTSSPRRCWAVSSRPLATTSSSLGPWSLPKTASDV